MNEVGNVAPNDKGTPPCGGAVGRGRPRRFIFVHPGNGRLPQVMATPRRISF
jgi:hypothetical protein